MDTEGEETDIKDEVATASSFNSISDQDVDGNVPSVSYQKPNLTRSGIEYKSNATDIRSEIGDEFLMDIKEEDEGPTASSFHSISDQDVDGNSASVSYHKQNLKRSGIECESNGTDIKPEIGDAFMMNVKEEEDEEGPTGSPFHNNVNQDVYGNAASTSYQNPNRKRGEIEYDFKSNGSDKNSEIGDEFLMDIKEEDEGPTASSFHSISDQDVDGNSASVSYHKQNLKRSGIECESNGTDIKPEIGDAFMMDVKEEEEDEDGPTGSPFHNNVNQDVYGNAASTSYQNPNRKRGEIEYDFKSNGSDKNSEIGDEFLMDIKEEETDIKYGIPPTSSLHSISDEDVDGNVPSVSYQKPNLKRGQIEYGFKSNRSDINPEIGEELLIDIKEEEDNGVPTCSSFHNDKDQDVYGNVALASYQKPNWKLGEIDFKSNKSDIKSEIGEEFLMDIKEEEIDIKDEILTASSFHNDNDEDVDDIVPSVDLHKSNRNYLQLSDFKIPGKKGLICNICGYKCDHKSQLIVHMRRHTGEKPFACGLCDFKTARKDCFISHMKSHTGEKPFVCDLCAFKSAHKSSLKTHMKSHTGEKPFVCDFCGHKSAQKANLKTHLRSHTGEKPFVCDLCDFKSAQKSHLTYHMRIHMGQKPFVCGLCDYKGAQKSHLTSHMKSHTGERPFLCGLCGFKSIHKSGLTYHMNSHHSGDKLFSSDLRHTGEKPFACDLCAFKSAHKSSLISHMKSHTGEKPFVCGLCDFKSIHKSGLTYHMNSHHSGDKLFSSGLCHTGEKPFVCGLCNYKSGHKASLAIHMRSHTGEKPYVCDVCGYKSAWKYSLVSHMKRHTL